MASRYPGYEEPRLQTQNIDRNPRFSYAPTPTQHSRSTFDQFSSPTNSSIDESPMSPHHRPRAMENVPITFFPSEKAIREEPKSPYDVHQPRSPYDAPRNIPYPDKVHPAYAAPYDDVRMQMNATPRSPSAKPDPLAALRFSPYATPDNFPSPPSFEPDEKKLPLTPRTPRTPTYNPHSMMGPNVAYDNHMPGQIAHPNSQLDPDWQGGICAADSSCCVGLFCPCILYGKVQYRLSQRTAKKDGTDLLGYKTFNGSCMLMGLGFCFSGVLASIQRTRIRKLYNIHGGITDDCMKCFCCCCLLVQNEREMSTREERLRRYAGPSSSAYVSPGQMTYAPPPR